MNEPRAPASCPPEPPRDGPRRVDPLPFPSDAELTLPGSKSDTNRLLVLAALSGREVTLRSATASDDVRRMIDGLRTLGYDAAFVDESADGSDDDTGGIVRVGPRATAAPTHGTIDCGNAGTALRFLVSVAAITPGDWLLTGDAAMQRRPIAPLVDAWRQLGITIEATGDCPPVRVHGGAPRPATVRLDASQSSQFLSSLLLVGGALPFALRICVQGALPSRDYVQWTLRSLQRCGVAAAAATREFVVMPGYREVPPEVVVDGDWSAMGVWTCLGHVQGSRVTARNLPRASGQADERLGSLLAALPATGDAHIDVRELPDQFLNVAATAALRPGTTTVIGGTNLRIKECDRIAVMARELRRVGADVDELPDGLVVRGGRPLHTATVDPADDHRVAMAFALLGLVLPGITVAAPECVAKSYPSFWRDLEAVRRRHRAVAIVGMRGAGKTTLGRALADRLGSGFVDTDERFVAAHGPIAAFVTARGWPEFRRIEAEVVAASLQPGTVVATGGGAVEDPATRHRLHEQAFVLWLDTPLDVLRTRLAATTDRPSLTGSPVVDELPAVHRRRLPLWREVAQRHIDGAMPLAEQMVAACTPLMPEPPSADPVVARR